LSKLPDLQTFDNTTMADPQAVSPPSMTAIEFLGLGLEIGGHKRWRTFQHAANIQRFKEAFGVLPETCVLIWDALRNSLDPTVRLRRKDKPGHLLVGIRFLWTYHEEYEIARFFGYGSNKTGRKWWKLYVAKIEKLLDRKVRKQHLGFCVLAFVVSSPSHSSFLLAL
jgi:hypothetical protein